MARLLLLLVSHAAALAAGTALGIYLLPILAAPPAPTSAQLAAQTGPVLFTGQFRRDLKGSDLLHWGEGTLSIGRQGAALAGRIAPGPNYKLYLSPVFVETREEFLRLQPQMVRVGDVLTFDNFVVALPAAIDPARYTTAIVWCESFSRFITAAKYR